MPDLFHEIFRDLLVTILGSIPLLLLVPVARIVARYDNHSEIVRANHGKGVLDLLRLKCPKATVIAEQPLSRQGLLHDRADSAGETACWCLLLKFEIHVRHSLLLQENPFLGRRLAKEGDVLEENLDDFGVLLVGIIGSFPLTSGSHHKVLD